jgi:squalene-associated FAD-dependent desaturase
VAVVGGGLAGLAASVALAECGVSVELFESRRRLGGRATSFRDPANGELVDHCQHVSMGCCTNLDDFCRRVGIDRQFRREPVLHFFGPDGAQYNLAASRWLPAPMHLGPALARLGYLSRGERYGIARAMGRLMREAPVDDPAGPTIGQWLREQRQSERAIERFWSIVLVSALSETIDRASLFYAHKVFVDGFMMNRAGYVMEVPDAALDELYGTRLEQWLAHHHVGLRLATPIAEVQADEHSAALITKEGVQQEFDFAIVALPWHAVSGVCSVALKAALGELRMIEQLEPAPITGIHLWFDREITPLRHAVLVGGLCQWLFRRTPENRHAGTQQTASGAEGECYYQVVVSASRDLARLDRDEIARQAHEELARIFPAAHAARLLRSKIVTEHNAVFSPRPGVDSLRPRQQTSVPTLALAGDWTDTGWPATMEGAVRSGYLAAEAALARLGAPRTILVDELPPTTLSKLLIRRNRITTTRDYQVIERKTLRTGCPG